MNYVNFDAGRDFDLVALGRAAIDFNPVDYYKTLAESTTFRKYVGGSPANIAVGLSRLGKKVGFFARVSDDSFGDYVVDYFKGCGIDVSRIRRCEHGEKLGLTFTEIKNEHESSILMYRDHIADLRLSEADIDEEYIKNAKALLVSGTALSESPSREAALKAVALAKKTNTPVVFDIDYRPYNWVTKEDMGVYYGIAAASSDIILGSREEYDLAEQFLGLDGSDEASAAHWHSQSAKIVIVKHGKEGSTAYTNDGKRYVIKPFPMKALKSFGGGDGYASAFLYGLFEGLDIIDCLELGSASASLLVASHSCSDGMPTAQKLRDFIAESKKQYGDMIARG